MLLQCSSRRVVGLVVGAAQLVVSSMGPTRAKGSARTPKGGTSLLAGIEFPPSCRQFR
jgi:hypothetical protein